jgi:hypothetical protein
MTCAADDDIHIFTERLAEECRKAGLRAEIVAPTRVLVSRPGAHGRLAELVRCMPDADERLTWFWSWSEPICPAAAIGDAVRAIAHVVTPPVIGGTPSS